MAKVELLWLPFLTLVAPEAGSENPQMIFEALFCEGLGNLY